MIYCGTRFDDLYLCELTVGHKGAHALRPRCVYCDPCLWAEFEEAPGE